MRFDDRGSAPRAWLVIVLALQLGSAGQATAQQAQLCVRVTSGGAAVSAVTVELTDAQARSLIGTTDLEGEFCFQGLAPGDYEVRASLSGFATVAVQAAVQLGQASQVQLELPEFVEEDITVTGSSDRELASAGPAWNSWTADAEVKPAEPVIRLRVGDSYDFYLELSRIADTRIGVLSVEPNESFIDLLRVKYLAGKTKLDAIARPTVIGRAVSLLDAQFTSQWRQGEWIDEPHRGRIAMEIRLAPLFEPVRMPFDRSRISEDDRNRARAGGIRFRVRAEQAGCAAIAVSVWEAGHNRMFDQVVHVLTVGEGTTCRTTRASQVASRGLLGLLGEAEAESRMGTLNLFEVDTGGARGKRTVFQYVGVEPSAPCEHFEWERAVLLADDLLENSAFRSLLYSARTQDRLGYAKAARYLRKKLFPRVEATCGGKEALEEIRRSSDGPRRSLEVRSVDVDNNDVFLPLNLLLALRDDDLQEAYFEHPFRLLQRLPLQTYGTETGCVRDWTFVLPRKLVPGSPEVKLTPAVANYAGTGSHRSLQDLDVFLDKMADLDEYERSPVGLVVLSHHNAGVLYDGSEALDIDWTDFDEIRVPSGSVAVFSACSVGDIARSPSLVATLGKIGFDAIVMSPFPVAGEFGAAVAVRFAELVLEARESPGATRVDELFDTAAAWAGEKLKKDTDSRSTGMPLEFLFAGNAGIAVCGREEPPQPE